LRTKEFLRTTAFLTFGPVHRAPGSTAAETAVLLAESPPPPDSPARSPSRPTPGTLARRVNDKLPVHAKPYTFESTLGIYFSFSSLFFPQLEQGRAEREAIQGRAFFARRHAVERSEAFTASPRSVQCLRKERRDSSLKLILTTGRMISIGPAGTGCSHWQQRRIADVPGLDGRRETIANMLRT